MARTVTAVRTAEVLGQDAERPARPRDNVAGLLPAPEAGGEMALTLARQAGPNMAPEDQEEAIARFHVIEPLLLPDHFPQLWMEAGRKKSALANLLAAQHGVERSTLYRWLDLWEKGRLPALVPQGRSDKGTPRVLNRAALDFILAASLPKRDSYGEFSVKEICRAYDEERLWRESNAGRPLNRIDAAKYARYLDQAGQLRPEAQLPKASYRTFARWFHNIPDALKIMARQGEDAFSSSQEILSWRALAKINVLEFVVMDHRVLDLFALVPIRGGWRLARPWLTAALDMRSRRWLAWILVETPSSDSIASVLKKVIFQHGIPEGTYWDNGRDFRSQYLEGRQLRTGESHRIEDLGEMMGGVLSALGIRVHHAIVKRARSKLIEPAFVNTANFDRALPYWVGNKPDARPERLNQMVRQHERWLDGKASESPFPTIDHIAGLYDEFLESVNEREHSGEGMEKVTPTGRGWMSPNECWQRHISDISRRTAPPEIIQMCFQRRKTLRVRNGEVLVTFGGRQFHYRMIDDPCKLMALNGREVEMGYDPHDLGMGALYCEGRFIGLVDNCELRSMSTEDFVADERDRRAARREVKRFIQNVHRAIPVPTAEQRAMRRAAVRPERIEPAREEVAAQLPAALIEAAAAVEKQRSFKFADALNSVPEIAVLRRGDEDDPDDGEFCFWSKSKGGLDDSNSGQGDSANEKQEC